MVSRAALGVVFRGTHHHCVAVVSSADLEVVYRGTHHHCVVVRVKGTLCVVLEGQNKSMSSPYSTQGLEGEEWYKIIGGRNTFHLTKFA